MTFIVRSTLFSVMVSCCVPAFHAHAQGPAPQVRPAQDVDQLIRAGIEFEKQRDWIKAIQHYEAAHRSYLENADISRRLLICRLHYDVIRRCNDGSISNIINRVSVADALELYSEVLARLETSYVEPVNLNELIRGGTAYLEVALTEPGFVERYLAAQSPEQIEFFRTSIHKQTLANRITTHADARNVVAEAARTAQQQLRIPPAATVMQFVFGAIGLLDPYSSFLSSSELGEVESQIEGNFVGLGIALQPHEVPLRVLSVIPGGPALEAGMQPGDLILKIDSVVCEDVGAEKAADLLRGPDQSEVRLVMRRTTGEVFERTVARRRVEVPSVEDVQIIEPNEGIAYLKISSFQKTTAPELDEALWNMHRAGMRSLIIDVRGNPGGWLDASVAVADRFLAEGSIVSTRGKNGIENQNYSATRGGTWQVPLVVLIDHDSASASEILAGAIADNRRGVVVGETSYGKGSVQGLFHTKALSSGIRLTVSKFYSPSGRAISDQGVRPTVAIDASNSEEVRFVAKPAEGHVALPPTSTTDRTLHAGIEQARRQILTAQVTRN
ncbi:S41 family peptidase [Aureliella helgolandensis]|nr:S41 family peptidase [Aureliella helgolandensis]